MNHLAGLPDWAALAVALLVLIGAAMTLIGCIGLVRLGTFYERVHAPTLGNTSGTICIVLASIVCFSALGSRLVLHEILVLVFVTMTTPVTLVMLARAAVYRDRVEGSDAVPPPSEGLERGRPEPPR